MTLYRIEHAVVMDTDDIPGRGGYSVVGISHDVTPAERAFVAGNFGISDYLHDPNIEKRIFYSTFRVPGGRRAFVRRFARGVRRNQTQNRLFIHTLLLDEDVYRRLHGLPWLLVNASVRAEGEVSWERLRDEVPWVQDGATLPALEWDGDDGVTKDVVARLNSRLTSIGNQLPRLPGGADSPSELVARVIDSLSSRVVLPQGSAYELVTMLAWSMLPRRDRDEIAWTQHDASNISGVTFQLANAVVADSQATSLTASAAPFAEWLVRKNTASEESWRDFHERAAKLHLTVREGQHIHAWQKWQDAFESLRHGRHESDTAIVASMESLAATAKSNLDAPWIDGHEVLAMIWSCVVDAVAKGRPKELAVSEWASRLHRSELDDVIFRVPPDPQWLERASKEVGADPLVGFFIFGTENDAASKPTRATVAKWVIDSGGRGVLPITRSKLAVRLAGDKSKILREFLEQLLATEDGLDAFCDHVREQKVVHDLVFEAVPIVLKRKHRGTVAFLRDVVVPRVDSSVKAELAEEVAAALRDDPDVFLTFVSRLSPEVSARLMELVTGWMFREPVLTLPLARAVLRQVQRDSGTIATAGPLAIALANAGEPAGVWFGVMLQMARATDAKNDAAASQVFLGTLNRLREAPLKLDGAMNPLVSVLESDAQSNARPGACVRATILFVRPVWGTSARGLISVLVVLLRQAYLVSIWEEAVDAIASDLGKRLRDDVSELVAAFWLKIDASRVPDLKRSTIDALAYCTAPDRKRLAALWSQDMRVRDLPPSPSSDRLLEALFGERVTTSRDLRMSLARRDLKQGIVTALNVLDSGLYAGQGERYAAEMALLIVDYLGSGSALDRMVRLLELFSSFEVQQSVKLVAEKRVLPKALAALRRSDWKNLGVALRDQDLLARGAPTLALARRAGAAANQATITTFEGVYSAHDRVDALGSAAAGRLTRNWWRSTLRFLGFETQQAMGR